MFEHDQHGPTSFPNKLFILTGLKDERGVVDRFLLALYTLMGGLLFLTFIMAMVGIYAVGRLERPSVPFVYDSDLFLPSDESYCPGDDIRIPVSGVADGVGRITMVVGSITPHDSPTPIRGLELPTQDIPSIDRPELAGKTIEFVYSRPLPETLIPGEYTYIHASGEYGGRSDSFATPFTIREGCP